MTTQATHEVEYTGYDPRSGRCSFSVPAGWGTGIPIANARLIEAEPELLEAADAIIAAWDAWDGETRLPDGVGEALAHAWSIAKTAITKARGQ